MVAVVKGGGFRNTDDFFLRSSRGLDFFRRRRSDCVSEKGVASPNIKYLMKAQIMMMTLSWPMRKPCMKFQLAGGEWTLPL